MGDWTPTPEFYQRLTAADAGEAAISQPYPFFLAHPLEGEPDSLGSCSDWQAEWKWDGIRSELVRRQGQSFLWSRGEELVTARYPEIDELAERIPDGTVLDGELLPWREGAALPFALLQKRIGRKTLSKKLLDEVPVVLVAYDLLESGGVDFRERPLVERRRQLEALVETVGDPRLILSPRVPFESWEALTQCRADSRNRRVEGLMLKRLDSSYGVGRPRGSWWKWKVEPFSVDAVLIYAQKGNGKRASLYTDYTFGVWAGDQLVPIAKAYSGLTDAEIRRVDAFIRQNTVEKFGPVRTVKPELVFELGFEGIQASPRHKSGIAVRFPRMLRWRTDKTAAEADTLDGVKRLLEGESESSK
jgi:DNA ligase-1